MLAAPCAVPGASGKIWKIKIGKTRIGKLGKSDWIDQRADANATSCSAHLVPRDHCYNRKSVERHG